MKLKKFTITSLLFLMPIVFLLATTPLTSFSEHAVHILFFAISGIGMAGYYLRSDIAKQKSKFHFSINFLILTVLLVFVSTHTMPCPYMFSPNAQTAIDHPCAQPATPSIPIVVFSATQTQLRTTVLPIPNFILATIVQSPNNRAPPAL